MKLKNYLLLLLISSTTAFGQSLTNQLVIGGNREDELLLYNQKDSTGYYLFGFSTSNASGSKSQDLKGELDYWLVKTDNDFNILWDKSIGGSGINFGHDALPHDNGVFIIGNTDSNISGDKTMDSYGSMDIWMLNVANDGSIIWQAQYGGSEFDVPVSFIEYSDTSVLILGESNSNISGNKTVASIGLSDIWLLEVSKLNGRIIQQKVIGSESIERANLITRNPYNNHLYIGATTEEGLSGDKSEYGYGWNDIWIIELDEELNIVRQKLYGGSSSDHSLRSLIFVGEHIFAAGVSQSSPSGNKTAPYFTGQGGSADIWLLKLNNDLSIVWDKTYGGNNHESVGSLLVLPEGDLVLTGSSKSIANTGNVTIPTFGVTFYDAWMVVLTEDGDIVYQDRFGGSLDDFGFLHKGNNGVYILYALSSSPVSGVKTVPSFGGSDLWIGTIDLERILSVRSANQELLNVYPNPVVNVLTVQGDYSGKKYEIIDLNGKVITSNPITDSQLTIDVSFLQTGLYILQLEEKQFKFSKR